MKKAMRLLKMFCKLLFLPFWHLEWFLPRDKNLWVFGAWFGQKYSDNSKYVFEYILKNHKEIKAVWITKNKAIYGALRQRDLPVMRAVSFSGIICCLRASVAVLSASHTDVQAYCLNGIKQIWVWHGMALKKILYDVNIKRKLTDLLHPWDITNPTKTIISSQFFFANTSTAFRLDKKDIWCTGLPRCDGLFYPQLEKIIGKAREDFSECTIILYMPTFRTAEWTKNPFDPFDFFKILQESNTVFLYKPHYYDNSIYLKIKNSRFIQINDSDYNDLYHLIAQIDVLMTDYSSVYFDFLSTGKPVILAPFDYDIYIKEAREHYFDYWTTMEGVKARNWQEVMSIIQNKTYYSVDEKTKRKFTEFNDGKSSEKVFQAIKELFV